jgi:RNA polymerase sigma-54 factor
MTPQLQQAIKLLQLGRQDFLEAIEQEVLENPILEDLREDDFKTADALGDASATSISSQPINENEINPRVDWDSFLESFTDYQGSASLRSNSSSKTSQERPSLEATVSHHASFEEFLLEQVRFLDLNEIERQITMHLIGNLDRNGYIGISFVELSEELKRSGFVLEIADFERVLEILQGLEPTGVFARDLRECLYLQLSKSGKVESLEGKLVLKHLDKLEGRKVESIAKEEGVTVKEVVDAIHSLRRLDPRPARPFIDEGTRYISPDIYVHKVGGDYVVSLNDDGIPRLRISPYYQQLIKERHVMNKDSDGYLSERLKSASWLIKSVQQRQQTIFKVTESIVKFQRAFLDQGLPRLKPLVLKDVADDIGLHESTVSRVTSNKYVQTPQGLFELKFFFTSGIKTASGEVSSSVVKERIKQLISQEVEGEPISDQGIVEILAREKIEIARRTVAKYRESLGIPSSSKRKHAI